MRLRFLGQQNLALVSGHVYQARWLVPGSGGDFPCPISDAKVTQARDILGTLGSVVTPGFSTADWEPIAIMKLPNQPVFDRMGWPADRREVPAPIPQGMCPIWTSSVPTQDLNVPLTAFQQALAPLGGILLNLWDNTSGQRIWDQPGAPAPVVIPSTPPVQPPFPPTQIPVPTTPAPVEEKTNPLIWVAVAGLAIGAVALVLR